MHMYALRHTHTHTHTAHACMHAHRQVVEDGRSIRRIQQSASAQCKDCPDAPHPVERLANMGNTGKWTGNLWRDFVKDTQRQMQGNRVYPFDMSLPVHHRRTRNIIEVKHPILFPHEVYSYVARFPEEFTKRIFGGDPSMAQSWWRSCSNESWFAEHPARRFAFDADQVVAPLRIYGDDCEHFKNQSCLIMSWSSPLCSLPVKQSRFLITALPLPEVVSNDTLNRINTYVGWSMQALYEGKWPALDPDGEPWPPGSDRAKLAGTDLDPVFGSRAMIGQLAGDWKFLKEVLHLPRHYNRRDMCHECLAVHHGEGPPFSDFGDEAEWADTEYTHEDYLRDLGEDLPFFVSLVPFFFLGMVLVDTMHVFHLGILLWAIGSELILLCQRGHFGHFRGDRKVRTNAALAAAYESFKAYTRKKQEGHSQDIFTLNSLGRGDSDDVYPEIKAKASNARVITQWLYEEIRDTDAPETERLLFWALAETLFILHAMKTTTFEAETRDAFVFAGRTALQANAELAREAGIKELALWCLKPKHHMFDHILRHAAATSRVPSWCFADEYFNGRSVRVARRVHRKGVGQRVVFTFLLRLWRALADRGDDDT